MTAIKRYNMLKYVIDAFACVFWDGRKNICSISFSKINRNLYA